MKVPRGSKDTERPLNRPLERRPDSGPGRSFPWAVVLLLLSPILLVLFFLPGLGARVPEEPTAIPRSSPSSRGDLARARRAPGVLSADPLDPVDPRASAAPDTSAEAPVLEGLAEHTLAGKTLWERRVIRAQRTLESYLESTKYPFSSQPIARHRDQEFPNFVGAVKLPLATGDGKKTSDARVTLNQDRAILQGDEAVVLRVSCENGEGPQPCVFAQPPVAFPPKQERGAEKITPAAISFAPENGDPTSMVGTFTPAAQGFAGYEGAIRIEGQLKIGAEEGSTSWQVTYTPAAPAVFTRKFREVIEHGSLSIFVGLQVDKPGRYVVTARGVSKEGKVFAFLQVNDELPRGLVEAKLQLFGKLIHDAKAEAPFVLRDVEGFLLRDGTYPDREPMSLLPGDAYTTRVYPLKSFSEADWESEEKTRHVEHYKDELKSAQDGLAKEKEGTKEKAGETQDEGKAP